MRKIAVIGPTCCGKTSKALSICKRYGGEIVSVDSRQAYKYMDIGTGKVPHGYKFEKGDKCWKVEGIKVWGYDIITPDMPFSVVDFAEFVSSVSFDKDLVVYVGGTGFYFDYLLGNKSVSGVAPSQDLRAELGGFSVPQLYKILKDLNPNKALQIDKDNSTRLVRAIEVERSMPSKERRSDLLRDISCVVGFFSSRENLYAYADEWVGGLLDRGLLAEVKTLCDLGFGVTPPLNGLIYKTAQKLLRREVSEDQALARMTFDTHAYIRRQETYFKKMPGISWLDISQPSFDRALETLVESKLDG